jgi:hypothetical protein
MLEKEFDYFIANQKDLVANNRNKFIVIVGNEVVGSYLTNEMAFYHARQKYQLGSFLIQHCIEGDGAYTCRFHSNIILNDQV